MRAEAPDSPRQPDIPNFRQPVPRQKDVAGFEVLQTATARLEEQVGPALLAVPFKKASLSHASALCGMVACCPAALPRQPTRCRTLQPCR